MKRTKHLVLAASLITAFATTTNAQWLTTGNALASTGFLGSTTNFDLSIITNNTSRLYVTKAGNVGIGTNTPAFLLDVFSTGNASANFKSSTGTANLIIDRGSNTATSSVSYRTAGTPTWQTGTVGTDNFVIRNIALASPALTILASNSNTGIGINAPTSRLHLVGSTSQTTPVLEIANSYVGLVDVRGINVVSAPADGYGIGVQSSAGYVGGDFDALAGAYVGYAWGLQGTAIGTAGARIGVEGSASNTGGVAYGVFGSASGSTAENSWGGYFTTKTYTNELRVGTTTGATGYILAVKGKVIAEEVRVALQAAWPDYVFDTNYNLMPINELKNSIANNKHLPGLPSACEVEENGLMLGDMQGKIVEKIEESHLYIIQLQQQIDELKAEIKSMKNQAPK